MAKVYLFVSKEEMLYQAHAILQEYKYPIDMIKQINTEDSELEARKAELDGANIIIARGIQARRIKRVTTLPVVEIVITSQEIALLINRARHIVKKEHPQIAIIGFKNMFCDMSFFEELYNIELRSYLGDNDRDLENAFYEAEENNPDLIIGGDFIISMAKKMNIPSLYFSSTEESLKNAFSIVEKMVYAMDMERKTTIQMETMLDYSFNAALRTDENGSVTMINRMMAELLEKEEADVKNQPVWSIIPELSRDIVEQVLTEGRENTLFLQIKNYSVYILLAPVSVDSHVEGLFLNCHKINKKDFIENRVKSRVQKSEGYIALGQFADLYQESESMKACIRKAKLMVTSDKPLMIQGEAGTERRMLAQSIHNDSLRSNRPFIDISCAGMSDETQREILFGPKGAALQANGGTLLLRNLEQLSVANQYRLYQLIRFKTCTVSDLANGERVDVRVMYTTKAGLDPIIKNLNFREDLYYAITGLSIKIPSLRERPEDLKKELEDAIRESCEKNSRYHVLTNGAWQVLLNYPWYGNHLQISNFCENMILTSTRRSIDENDVTSLLLDAYPETPLQENRTQDYPFEGDEAALIRKILEKNLGSRDRTALELKLSKSTLWRKMKKYGIK